MTNPITPQYLIRGAKALRMINAVLLLLILMIALASKSKPWWAYSVTEQSSNANLIIPMLIFLVVILVSATAARQVAMRFSNKLHCLLFLVLSVLTFLLTGGGGGLNL